MNCSSSPEQLRDLLPTPKCSDFQAPWGRGKWRVWGWYLLAEGEVGGVQFLPFSLLSAPGSWGRGLF